MSEFKVIHNSHKYKYRDPFGAVICGSKISLGLDILTDNKNVKAEVVIIQNEIELFLEMNKTELNNGYYFSYDYISPKKPGICWYYFKITIGESIYFYGNNLKKFGGEGILADCNPIPYQITNHKEIKVPDWFKETIMYQIFVDRFNNSGGIDLKKYRKGSMIHSDWYDTPYYIKDEQGRVVRWDFFGGNLEGIIEKLDYLKELGVGAIYLNPIFEAWSNHKYDTGDYKKIDKAFGDEKVLKLLIDKASKKNIKIILDGVFSHTGSDSKYFNRYGNYEELGAYQSKESPYYSWYRFSKFPQEYESWWGIDSLPNVNEMNPTYLDFIITGKNSVIKHWMNDGIKGFRLDVADELPDEFIKELKKISNNIDEESVIIGEVWEDASNKISYGKLREYFYGDELDSVMNYPFRQVFINFMLGNIDGNEANKVLMSLYENYPREIFYSLMNLIGSHDRERILTVLNDNNNYKTAVKRLKLLVLIQFTFPGVPCIYYGDEAGLEGDVDPDNRRPYPWGRENRELIDWYKKAAKIRNSYDAFKKGKWEPYYSNGNVYAYIRESQKEKIICIFNRSLDHVQEINIGEGKIYDIINHEYLNCSGNVEIKPLEGKIFIKVTNKRKDDENEYI